MRVQGRPGRKGKVKAKAPLKAKTKAPAKAKSAAKAKPPAKATAKAKAPAKPKAHVKAKPGARAKAGAKPKSRAKARPAPRTRPKSPPRGARSTSEPAVVAVEAAVVARARGARLFNWGVRKSWAEGGPDPLEHVWAYASEAEAPHWHYVTGGMTDPAKVESAPSSTSSGLGYELTFRLARAPGETAAPVWPVHALQELGWGILQAGMKVGAGHYIRRRNVITGGAPPTELQGYYLLPDPHLRPLATGTGSVAFLQLVGITEDELLRCEAGEPDALEADLRAGSPLGITDIDRTTPPPDPDDLVWMSSLQRVFGERCRDIVPDGVTGFCLSASLQDENDAKAGKLECVVESPVPFTLNARAEAALRRIFLALAARGEAVDGLRVEMVSKPDGAWSTVIELDHRDIAAVEPAS
jgi:hypothetical protein